MSTGPSSTSSTTRAEILGQNYFFLAGTGTDPEIETNIRTAMMAQEPLNQEVLLCAKTGREVWAAQFVSPMRDTAAISSSTSHPSWTSPAGSRPSTACNA
jgi:hypothetical protein